MNWYFLYWSRDIYWQIRDYSFILAYFFLNEYYGTIVDGFQEVFQTICWSKPKPLKCFNKIANIYFTTCLYFQRISYFITNKYFDWNTIICAIYTLANNNKIYNIFNHFINKPSLNVYKINLILLNKIVKIHGKKYCVVYTNIVTHKL